MSVRSLDGKLLRVKVTVMVFNTTFNNISVISWGSIVLVEETGIQEENHRPVSNHGQILPHNVKLLNKTVILVWKHQMGFNRKLQLEEGHTMPKGNSIQRQTMFDQIQHKNQRLSNTSSMKKTGWNQMPRKGEQFLLH
jgi:hypothetical protein